ncbi:NTP/NDP exchange transporter [Candidatus Protochlamydia amoebophila]|uniref:ADP,ATP carrier protein n=1 Tax=Candidatus Protochlamydia amoebophila TaxID=362787 RepID=A0A0C1HGY6_9BACT|nr:NTP/NDP exchange transporter [Candidatus Protochlamydia amoebophila]KIC73928.1 ADP,ATP carrier protein 1 [Candidatus Protochlamydia amoebophila]
MSQTPTGSREFSPWRSNLWPVHRYELKKLIPMLLIFFFISFDYNILRTLKDSLLITAKSSGAEVIPFVKVWAMFPGAILMTLLFTWLSNRLSREIVFYLITSLFLSYFFIFTFILYPIRDIIHPHATADYLETILPIGFKGLVAMFRYWTFTIFYVMSELWGSTVLFVLFWGFANQVTKISEAKRFYGLFGVGANFSGIFAGQASVYCCQFNKQNDLGIFGSDPWYQSLVMMVSLILLSGALALALFRWMNVEVLTDKRFYDPSSVKTEGEAKGKLSLKQSFSYLLRSNYLLCVALIVISYNLVINLTEVLWKHQVRELYPDPNDYTLYMNHIVSIIGVVATLSSLFVSGNAIRKFGWTTTALITPIILAVTSLGFFSFFFLKKSSPEIFLSFSGVTPLVLVVFFGTAQNILSRGAKYSVFDATKEMSFVPLNPESKLVGKAAIDGVCSRLGKSGGSVVHQSLLLLFSTINTSAPYVAIVLFAVIVVWVMAIRVLGKQFNELTNQLENNETSETLMTPIRAVNILSDTILKEQKAV